MGKSALELEREARIAANKQRMLECGLLQTVQAIATQQTEAAKVRRAAKATVKASRAARRAAGDSAGRVRRSERVAGLDAPNYNENERLLSLADPEGRGSRDRRLMRENVSEEVYDVSHLDALGSYQQEWELFVDGYDAAGNRIYDKVNGQTCHQCRQKTLGKRTCCAGCESLTGVLCGDCLFMRYGENVDEVNANPDWRCPHCRDLCNCSFHRSKRGWAPTGTLYRHALAEGYLSCAHFLVLNNLSEEAKPVALERGLCPPELAAELKKEVEESKKAAEQKGNAATEAAPAAAARAEQPAAAVEAQLLEPEEGEQEEPAKQQDKAEPKAGARRSARGVASASQPPAAAGGAGAQKPKRQGTLQLTAAGVRKATSAALAATKAGGAAAAKGAGKGKAAEAAAAPERRGLRSSARIRTAA